MDDALSTHDGPLRVAPEAAREPAERQQRQRLDAMVRDNLDFVWRSLRRLGLPPHVADDAVQRVFLVARDRLADVAFGSERAFLFKTAAHVASSEKRSWGRRREDLSGEAGDEQLDPAPSAEEQLDRQRALSLVDELIQELALDLRAVFVLFELEGLSTAEIASTLELPVGTVSSRLRRAREDFQGAARRHQARGRATRGYGGMR